MPSMSRTYAVLEVSPAAYAEIRDKSRAARIAARLALSSAVDVRALRVAFVRALTAELATREAMR